MIGLDCSTAYDRDSYKALFFLIKQLGIGGSFFNILFEFLSNRTQRFVVAGLFGEFRPVISGVLQDSYWDHSCLYCTCMTCGLILS